MFFRRVHRQPPPPAGVGGLVPCPSLHGQPAAICGLFQPAWPFGRELWTWAFSTGTAWIRLKKVCEAKKMCPEKQRQRMKRAHRVHVVWGKFHETQAPLPKMTVLQVASEDDGGVFDALTSCMSAANTLHNTTCWRCGASLCRMG